MTQDRHSRSLRAELLPGETAADDRVHPEDREQVVQHERCEYAFGHVAAGNVAIAEIESASAAQRAGAANVGVLDWRKDFHVRHLG